jgi:hypothetical protein
LLPLCPDQEIFPFELLAVKDHVQAAFLESLVDELLRPFSVGGAGHVVGAFIPDHDGTCAIIAFGNDAFEEKIIQRMVLHHDGEPFVLVGPGRAFRYGPALEGSPCLEAQVVMEAAGLMLLNDETERSPVPLDFSSRLGRVLKIALGLISLKSHRRSGIRSRKESTNNTNGHE